MVVKDLKIHQPITALHPAAAPHVPDKEINPLSTPDIISQHAPTLQLCTGHLLSMESSNDESQQVSNNLPDMFRPPVNRAMRTLDRSFFRKTVPIAAAKVFKNSEISKVRQELHKVRDLLAVPRLSCVRDLQGEDGVKKALLLRGDLRPDGGWFLVID